MHMPKFIFAEPLESRRLLAEISGTIYHDANNNNQPDPGEGLPGCVVTFNNNADHTVRTPVTDANGEFATQIEAGDYSLNVDGPGVAHPLNQLHFAVTEGENFLNVKLATEGGGGGGGSGSPDLAVTITPLPLSFGPKSKPALITVQNKGAAYTGPIDVDVYFSSDKVIDGNDQHLPTVHVNNVSIGAKKKYGPIPVDLAAFSTNLPGGEYFILAKVTGTSSDANSANDTAISKNAVKVVTPSINLTPSVKGAIRPNAHTKIAPVSLSIKNSGTVTANGGLSVSIVARPTGGGADIPITPPPAITVSIGPGKSVLFPKLNVNLSSLPAGAYRLVITIATLTTPAETSTTDNTVSTMLFTIK
jgi:hypothetical protein